MAGNASYSIAISSIAMPTWDELRKEARMLDSEIDTRLDSYSKYAQSLLRADAENPTGAAAAAVAASDLDPNLSISAIDNHGVEIKRLLQQFGKVKEEMSRYISRQDMKDRENLLPVLHQYEGKYSAYARDLKKSEHHVHEAMQQLLLGKNFGKEKEQLTRKEALLRERNTISSAEQGIDNLLSQAHEAKQKLVMQNDTMMKTITKIKAMGGNIPGLNDLMNRIARAKQREVFILAGVIAVCICFLLWWGFG